MSQVEKSSRLTKHKNGKMKEEEAKSFFPKAVFCVSVIAVAIACYTADIESLNFFIDKFNNYFFPPLKPSSTIIKKPYSKSNITNKADMLIRQNLDSADNLLDLGKFEEALRSYDALLKNYPKSPRIRFSRANVLDKLADKQKSNPMLEEAINAYIEILELNDVPIILQQMVTEKAVERLTFRGWGSKAVSLLKKMIEKLPNDFKLHNKLGVTYLMFGQIEKARNAFLEVLERSPKDGFAMVHYGFILKTKDNNIAGSIKYLEDGMSSNEPGTDDARFYFHLGDAYHRNGLTEKAYNLYELGAKKKHFRSKWQRSLYNVDRLTGRPWWTPEEMKNVDAVTLLEKNWKIIRDEGLANLDESKGAFIAEEENLREKGDWKQFTIWQQGRRNKKNCLKAPKTCDLIDQIIDAKTCTRGQVKFSIMKPGVHVWPHCGPTNCRIRAHLGLVVPTGPRIRVAEETRTWSEGKVIIFDDSFEHEVWHDGNSFRMVLIVDFWHPELTENERKTLTPI